MTKFNASLAIVLITLLTGCCGTSSWGFPYKASVQQGNWITQEQIDLLQLGMTRKQVQFILGSPTLLSMLHANRWDYPYLFKPGYGHPSERKFTTFFQGDLLVRWKGDAQPVSQPFQSLEKRTIKSAACQKPDDVERTKLTHTSIHMSKDGALTDISSSPPSVPPNSISGPDSLAAPTSPY